MKDEINSEIKSFISEKGSEYYSTPLVGFSSINHTLYRQYKKIIGSFHMTPREVFQAEDYKKLDEGTVISWVLPFNETVRDSNKKQDKHPSKEWAHGRYFGEKINKELREHITNFLVKKGYQAIAPQVSSNWESFRDDKVGLASTWSERHAAYASGLGTFSLNDGLITSSGIAHRCGNIVTDLVIEPTSANYSTPFENCLFYSKGTCGVCIKRCPAGAITTEGHDKDLCRKYIGEELSYLKEAYGVEITGCGLCQTGIPCEKQNPSKRK